MINPDLTDVFEKYCEWDYIVRNKYLRYASRLLEQNKFVMCRGIQYHNLEDLKVDLDFDCNELYQETGDSIDQRL